MEVMQHWCPVLCETGHSKSARGVALSDGCVHLLLVAASLQGQILMQRPNHALNSLTAFCLSAEANYVYWLYM